MLGSTRSEHAHEMHRPKEQWRASHLSLAFPYPWHAVENHCGWRLRTEMLTFPHQKRSLLVPGFPPKQFVPNQPSSDNVKGSTWQKVTHCSLYKMKECQEEKMENIKTHSAEEEPSVSGIFDKTQLLKLQARTRQMRKLHFSPKSFFSIYIGCSTFSYKNMLLIEATCPIHWAVLLFSGYFKTAAKTNTQNWLCAY